MSILQAHIASTSRATNMSTDGVEEEVVPCLMEWYIFAYSDWVMKPILSVSDRTGQNCECYRIGQGILRIVRVSVSGCCRGRYLVMERAARVTNANAQRARRVLVTIEIEITSLSVDGRRINIGTSMFLETVSWMQKSLVSIWACASRWDS